MEVVLVAKLCGQILSLGLAEGIGFMGDVTGIERTLVLLKPDAVTRGLVGRVLSRFEEALLKIIACKMVQMDADLNRQHYFDLEDRFGPEVYNAVAAFMQTGPGTIRGDFAHQSSAYANATGLPVANLVHASANVAEAKREIDVWFAEGELHEYKTLADRYIW